MFDHSTQKKALRKSFLSLRTKLRNELGENWEQSLLDHFQKLLEQHHIHFVGPILSYFPIQDEPKILPAQHDKPWFFPKSVGLDLQWFPWAWGQSLPPTGRFHIPEAEAASDIGAMIQQSSAICFTPALAVDLRGYRLGYGKGYYDRFLSRQDLRNKIVSVVLLHESQIVDELPTEPHDAKIDLCVTNERILFFNEKTQVLSKLGN